MVQRSGSEREELVVVVEVGEQNARNRNDRCNREKLRKGLCNGWLITNGADEQWTCGNVH